CAVSWATTSVHSSEGVGQTSAGFRAGAGATRPGASGGDGRAGGPSVSMIGIAASNYAHIEHISVQKQPAEPALILSSSTRDIASLVIGCQPAMLQFAGARRRGALQILLS